LAEENSHPYREEGLMLFDGGFSFSNFLVDVLTIFAFIVWFWLLVVIFGDLFRRTDIGGWAKALWVIAVIFTSYIGILVYLITQGRGITRRNLEQAQASRDELRRVVGFSVADELEKLSKLKNSGSLSEQEFAMLRAKLVQ
jgi:hypothetical protein